jgi:hypothetical protein
MPGLFDQVQDLSDLPPGLADRDCSVCFGDGAFGETFEELALEQLTALWSAGVDRTLLLFEHRARLLDAILSFLFFELEAQHVERSY